MLTSGLRRFAARAAAVAASILLLAADSDSVQYYVVAYSESLQQNFASSTHIYDGRWRELRVEPNQMVPARQSPYAIDLGEGVRFMELSGVRVPPPCHANAFSWAVSPSARYYACADGDYANIRLRVFRFSDRRLLRDLRPAQAWIERRNSLAFVDDDRLGFARVDATCPEEPKPKFGFSIVEISVIAPRASPKVLERCAAGVVPGTHRVGFTRRMSSEYTLDGTHWSSGSLYGFDEADLPITEEHPLIRAFKAQHPDLILLVVRMGLATGRP